jgi:hypothetical protein
VTGIRHATDQYGRVLVLSRRGDGLEASLRQAEGAVSPHVRLTVDDMPPVLGATGLGRVRLSGPLHRVLPRAEKAAVLEFARGRTRSPTCSMSATAPRCTWSR